MVLTRFALSLLLANVLPTPTPVPAPADGAGVVRLPRAEYDKLKDAADKAREAPPKKAGVVPPTLEGAAYELRVSPERIVLELTADVVVKPSAAESRLTLPLPGLLDALTDKGPAAVGAAREGDALALVFPKPGRYRVAARFVPAETRAEGQRSVEFAVLPAASARLAAYGTETLALSVSGAKEEPLPLGTSRSVPASAFVRAIVKSPARITAPAEKPLVLADTVDVFRVERDRIAQRVFARVSVTRAPLAQLALKVASGAQVASVTGPGDPSFESQADGRVVLTPAAPLNGDASFSLLLTRPAPKESEAVDLVPTSVDGAASSRSWLLLDPNPLREQQARRPDGVRELARVDLEDLPAFALPFASEGTRAYRVAGAAPRLALLAPLRSVVSPADTLLSDADLLTVFGDGGSRVDRRRFVFETKVPHLDVPIAEGEQVLSVSVDGAPVTPRVDGASLVVTLPPSANARRLVEVTSKSPAEVPKKRGEMTVAQKALPGVASLARWTIVLPDDRRYRVAKSDGVGRAGWSRDVPAAMLGDINVITKSGTEEGWIGGATAGTATLTVKVTDGENANLPGVSVQIRSSALQGTRTAVTDASGLARFPNLPAGTYIVRSALAGFSETQKQATLSSDSGTFVSVPMRIAGVTAETVVTGEAPVVDTTKTTIGTTFSTQDFRAPRRSKAAVPSTLPPPKSEPEPVSIQGASSFENQFTVNGVVALNEATQAGTRSLPMEVTGHGKRLLLVGPLVGAQPVSVTLEVKPK